MDVVVDAGAQQPDGDAQLGDGQRVHVGAAEDVAHPPQRVDALFKTVHQGIIDKLTDRGDPTSACPCREPTLGGRAQGRSRHREKAAWPFVMGHLRKPSGQTVARPQQVEVGVRGHELLGERPCGRVVVLAESVRIPSWVRVHCHGGFLPSPGGATVDRSRAKTAPVYAGCCSPRIIPWLALVRSRLRMVQRPFRIFTGRYAGDRPKGAYSAMRRSV